MSSTQTTERTWTEGEVQAFWQKVGTFRAGLPPAERDAFTTIFAAGVEQGVREGGDEVQGYAAPVVGAFLLGWAAGKMLDKVAEENKVFDAVDWQKAAEQLKGKQKPPA